jgi:hypothetical protein
VTTVNLKFRQITDTGAIGAIANATQARILVRPDRRTDSTDGEVLPVWSSHAINDSVNLPPGPYRFQLSHFPDGDGGELSGDDANQIRMVPSSGTFDIDDLAEITPTGSVALEPEWKVYIDQQIQSVAGGVPVTGSGPGGELQPIDLYNVTTLGQNITRAADGAAVRGLIGAGTSNLALGTTSSTAKAGDYQPTRAQISDATTFGRTLMALADAAAGLTALGAASASGLSTTNSAAASLAARVTAIEATLTALLDASGYVKLDKMPVGYVHEYRGVNGALPANRAAVTARADGSMHIVWCTTADTSGVKIAGDQQRFETFPA